MINIWITEKDQCRLVRSVDPEAFDVGMSRFWEAGYHWQFTKSNEVWSATPHVKRTPYGDTCY